MRVKLPNGQVIEVPDGTKKHMVSTMAIQQGLAKPEDFGYDAVAPETGNIGTAIQGGVRRVGRNVTNLLLPDSLTPEWASDEAIQRAKEIDAPMKEAHPIAYGAGEVLATLPAGGTGGLAAKVGARGTGLLAKALGTKAGQAAVEGATAGTMLADPGERLEGAAGGAAGGAVLSKAFRGAANLATKGITDVIPEAKRLYRLTREVDPKTKKVVGEGMFIPLSQSASNNIVKMVYNTFMANLPWAGGVIRGQRDDAVNAFRNFAGHKAIPDGITVPDEYVVKPSDSIDLVVDKVTRFWDEHAYSDVKALQNLKALKFDTPTPPSWLIDEVAKQSKKTLAPFKPGQTFTGEEFINLKRTISEIMPRLSKSLKPEAVRYQQQLDDLLKKNLVGGKRPNKQGRYSGGMADVWENYRTLGEHWPEANAFIKAAQSGPDFTNKALARSTHSITTNPQAKGPIQRGAADTLKGLENFPSKQGAFVTLATTGALGHMFAGMTGASAAIVGGIIAGRIGVSQGLQKFLSGQTRKQALTRIARKKYRKELAAAGMAARDIAIVMGSQDAS